MIRIDMTDLKERIAIGGEITPQERNFLLDLINDAASRGRTATAFLDPGSYLGRIEAVYAYVSVDAGGEGVCAAPMGGLGMVPLIAADEARLKSIAPLAKTIARLSGKIVRLARFTKREDLEVINP